MTQNDDLTDGNEALLGRRSVLALAGTATLAGVVGAGSAGASSSLPNRAVIDATNEHGPCDYTIEVTGEIAVEDTPGNTVSSETEQVLEGTIDGGYCAVTYDGDVVSMSLDGCADLLFGEAAADAYPATVQEIGISGLDELSYEFTASGPITPRDAAGADVVQNTDGSYTARGTAGDGTEHSFEVRGQVESFDPLVSDHEVTVDGEPVSPATLTGVDEPSTRRLDVVSPESSFDYEFTVDGEVARVRDGSDRQAELANDEIAENGDGTYAVTGFTGNGYGDGFAFTGDVTSFDASGGDYTLYLDGEPVTASELTGDTAGQRRIDVQSAASDFSYQFVVTGDAELITEGSGFKAEGNDDVVENPDGTTTVTGFTGNGYGDGFTVTGDVLHFSGSADEYTIYVDGEETSVDDLVAAGGMGPGALIGGGTGYRRTVTAADADVVVATRSELSSALSNASAGDLVFVDGDADIDAGTATFTVPSGVTLASDRGVAGSSGGRIYTDDLHPNHYGMVRVESDARVTGLRVVGPIDPDGWTAHSRDYELTGIYVQERGVEVDNVEACGWGYANVYTSDDTHVHHCELHHANVEGLGYGVMANSSENPIVEYNEFYHNRHAITGSGGGGYTARYNVVRGPSISHVFDQHQPGGTNTKIYENTIEVVDNAQKSKNVPAVAVRGVPDGSADVHDNWFHNPKQPRSTPSGWTDEAIIQVHTSSWQNVDYWNNHYGSDEPELGVGAPR